MIWQSYTTVMNAVNLTIKHSYIIQFYNRTDNIYQDIDTFAKPLNTLKSEYYCDPDSSNAKTIDLTGYIDVLSLHCIEMKTESFN